MEPNHPTNRLRDILLLTFSLVGILVLAGRGLYLAITGFIPSFSSTTGGDLTSNIYGAISMFFCALLLLPVAIFSIRHLRGASIPRAQVPPIKFRQVAGLALIWVIAIVLGSLINGIRNFGWIIALPFFLLGMALPIAALIWIAIGGLPTGSWRRLWTSLNFGMTISTVIALVLELLAVAGMLLVVIVIAALDPALRTTLSQLRQQLSNAGDMQALLPIIEPYLSNPLVFLTALLFVSGIGPLIEEAAKPLAVWFVGRRLRSPAEGFALGALCGAGFALLEGMLVTSTATDMLGFSLAGRATSSLMHITASALMGWGIASALLQKRYGRLAGIYLLSTAIHGLWNGSVLLTVFGGLKMSVANTPFDVLGGLATVLGIGMLGLMLVSIVVLLPLVNRRLRTAVTPEPVQNDIIASRVSQ